MSFSACIFSFDHFLTGFLKQGKKCKKYFCWLFGSNENFRICFRNKTDLLWGGCRYANCATKTTAGPAHSVSIFQYVFHIIWSLAIVFRCLNRVTVFCLQFDAFILLTKYFGKTDWCSWGNGINKTNKTKNTLIKTALKSIRKTLLVKLFLENLVWKNYIIEKWFLYSSN